jgi:type I restriction enzyme M protein
VGEIREAILAHKEFVAFGAHVLETLSSWRDRAARSLRHVSTKDHPKAIIQGIADDLLASCSNLHLIDNYDVYQHLMTYWAETMQDDAYIITVDGWGAGKQVLRLQRETNGKKKDAKRRDIPGLNGLEGRLIPVSLLIATYFGTEKKQLEEFNARLEWSDAQMEELKDEHGGEEGLLAEVIENDKISKGNLQKRIKEVKDAADYVDELAVLQKCAALFDEDAETKIKIKEAEQDLEKHVLAKYPALSIDEIKTLVVERKWLDALAAAHVGEVDRLSQILTSRVTELTLRYAVPMPAIAKTVEDLSSKVETHLKKMGFVWK